MTDVVVLSAHPDDAELACSGTVAKLTREGRSVVFVECTRGELGTRGTPELREQEAAAAARILGVSARDCLDMADGAIDHNQENILKIVTAIRHWKPTLLLIPPPWERHPDHEAVHRLARAAAFSAGLHKVETTRNGQRQEPHRPRRMLCFQQHYDFPKAPDVYVDITDTFDVRQESIRAFASQFHLPEKYDSNEPVTYISRPDFLLELDARARTHGAKIGVTYAEAFLAVEPIGLSSLSALL